ncbi:hypothetical protein KY361_00195 [Candidatus Woesearchaeota archaeon]|nr:hypothetical protein [Candidatus Woesearchaeota archaeon]
MTGDLAERIEASGCPVPEGNELRAISKDAREGAEDLSDDIEDLGAIAAKARKYSEASSGKKEKISRIEDYLEGPPCRFYRRSSGKKGDVPENIAFSYTGFFNIVARKTLDLTRYEADRCLAGARVKALERSDVQDCIRPVDGAVKRVATQNEVRSKGSVKRVIKLEVIDPENLEGVLEGVIISSRAALKIKATQSEFISVVDYLRQNHPNLFRRLNGRYVNERAIEIGKKLVEEGVIPKIGKRLGNAWYYFRRDFDAMESIDKFVSENYVTFYSVVMKVVAEDLGLSERELSSKTSILKRRYMERPEFDGYLERRGQLYVRYGEKQKVEGMVRQLVRGPPKRFVRVLYAIWDYKEARGYAAELARQVKDQVDLEVGFLDLSKEEKIEELADKMMFGPMEPIRYDFAIINLGENDEQAEDAYFFADACAIAMDHTALIAECSNCRDRKAEASDHFKEFYITALTAGRSAGSAVVNGRASFVKILADWDVLSN